MVNTNNTKFTFNKKGLALSLACVGLLATAGNAGIEGTGVSAVNGSTTNYNVTVGTLSNNLTITGSNNVLGFSSGGAMTISGGVILNGTGSLKQLDLFNASGSGNLTLKDNLNINVDTKTMNIGNGTNQAFTISGGTLNFGQGATFDTVNLNKVTFSSGGSIINAGTIKDMVIGKDGFNYDLTETKSHPMNFTNTGTITTLTNNANIYGQGATFDTKASGAITLDLGKVGTFNQNGIIQNVTLKGSSIGTFTNAGEISINGSGAGYELDVTATNFTNKKTIDFASGTKIGTINITADNFTNAKDAQIKFIGEKDGLTITANKKFENLGTIKGASGGSLDDNAGTITLKNTESAKNSGLIQVNEISFIGTNKLFENSGIISGGTIALTNANSEILTFTNAAKGEIKGTEISGAGTIQTFNNAGTITNSTLAKHVTIGKFDNSGKITELDTTGNAYIKDVFNNSGTIASSTIKVGKEATPATTFTNAATGVITGSTITAFVDDFSNLGKITALANSTITAYKTFNNAGSLSGGTITLKGADSERNAVFAGINSGTIQGTTISFERIHKSFDNSGIISGGTISGTDATRILTFNNTATGVIKGTEITGTGTIQTLNNAGVMSVKASNANVAAFQNSDEFTLSGGGAALKVLTSFNNAEKAILTTANATNTEKIQLGNGKTANTTETTFNNAGTIDGKNKLEISTANGWVKSFTNTGLIDKTNITSDGANGIVTFTNSGTIDNSTLKVNVVNFNNLEGGLIDFRGDTNNSINLSDALGKTASFNNAGTIDNLASAISVGANVTNVSFKNSGSISQKANTIAVLSLQGASNLDFNNSGTIALAGTNNAITAGVAGAKANIINTGAITLGNGGAHMDLTPIAEAKDAPFVVREWHLSNIGSANGYNGNGTSDGRDKIVVKGFGNRDIATGTSKLRFDKGSIVIDPIKNTGIEVGKAYMLDRIVVDSAGAAVEQIHADDGTAGTHYDALITAAYELNKDTNTYTLKAGVEDPRLVTIDTIRSSDPIFELYGVDAYAKEGKVGEVIPGASGATTTRKGDGIIDSFQVGVNPSKGAGAAAVQSAVNNSITRNAFVGNVVNTAVNSALASLNNLNRVSYNDEEVDFSELEKYAAVSSDVTDQTYAKDSNVYVMPYYRSTSVDLAGGSSLDADTYGIVLGGNKNLGNAGVIGLFLGYENADGSANTLDTEDDTFFGGINYYKTLGGTSTYDYFVKGMLRLANTSSDVTIKAGNNETSSADTFSYGIEANVGMNFYNGIHTITPEVGLSYDRVEVDGFTLNRVDYSDNNINLVVGKIGLNWLAQFTESVSTNVGFGIRYNFNDDFDTSLKIPNGGAYSTKTDLGDFYYYLNLGVNVALTQNWELGVMYNGDFSSDASSHSGFVKLGYWW